MSRVRLTLIWSFYKPFAPVEQPESKVELNEVESLVDQQPEFVRGPKPKGYNPKVDGPRPLIPNPKTAEE